MSHCTDSNIVAVRSYLNSVLLERSLAIDCALACMLTKNHIFLYGPPGTAKSYMVDELTKILKGSKSFSILFSKSTKPEELFGPIKLSALKNDSYERRTEGFMPDAEFVFADEIWKADSVLNTCLKIFNERIFFNDGKAVKCPLITVFAASNELPEDSSYNALYDRFLYRLDIRYLESIDNFVTLMKMSLKENNSVGSHPELDITKATEEFANACKYSTSLQFSDKLIMRFFEFVNKCRSKNIIVSDRRCKSIIVTLRALFYIRGETINEDIFYHMADMMWYSPEERLTILRIASNKEDNFLPVSTQKTVDFEQSFLIVKSKFSAEDINKKEAVGEVNQLISKMKAEITAESDRSTIYYDIVNRMTAFKKNIILGD